MYNPYMTNYLASGESVDITTMLSEEARTAINPEFCPVPHPCKTHIHRGMRFHQTHPNYSDRFDWINQPTAALERRV